MSPCSPTAWWPGRPADIWPEHGGGLMSPTLQALATLREIQPGDFSGKFTPLVTRADRWACSWPSSGVDRPRGGHPAPVSVWWQALQRNRGSRTITSPNKVAMRCARQSFMWHRSPQDRQSGRSIPWLAACPATIARWTLPRSCLASSKVKPRSAISWRLSGRQISARSVLRQQASSSLAINRNTRRIHDPPAGKWPDRS